MNLRNVKLAAEAEPVRIVPPYPFTYTFRVKHPEAGTPLLTFLLKRFPFRDEAGWAERIKDGRILCNDQLVRADRPLKSGDRITHHNPRVTEPSVPDAVRILKETPDWMIVYKPAPMPVHPGGRYTHNTLISILEELKGETLHIIHRLDSVTSGLMLIGKTPEFSHEASLAFKQGDVSKAYFALTDGVPQLDSFSCDQSVKREVGYRFTCGDEGKEALTNFEVVKKGAKRAIIRCEPVTGRTHQIRLHLAWMGYPIHDDNVYKAGGEQLLQNAGISLQSSLIRIPALDVNYSLEVPSHWYDKL